MSKQRIIDYVMNTPGNTNPNVLNSLLDEEMNDLPDTSSASAGDVLSLNKDKEPIWMAPSSGGGMIYVDMASPSDNDPALLEQMMSDLRYGSERIYYTVYDGMLAPVLGFERSISGASKFGGAKADVMFISSDGMVKKTEFEIDAETFKGSMDEFYFTGLTKMEI